MPPILTGRGLRLIPMPLYLFFFKLMLYPENTYKFNLFAVLKILRPFLADNTFNKIRVLENAQELYNYIDFDSLPQEYGGTLNNNELM